MIRNIIAMLVLVWLVVLSAAVNLPVQFKAQVPPGNWTLTNNCGQASSSMVFNYRNSTTPTEQNIKDIDDWLFQHYSDPVNNYNGSVTTTEKLKQLSIQYAGFANTVTHNDWNLDNLKASLNNGNPVIVAVRLNMASSGTGHFMVLRGYDDTYLYFNDPGHSLENGGENAKYTFSTFITSWGTQNNACVVVPASPLATITVTNPTAGAVWYKGMDYNITWTSSGISGNVKIELYKGSQMVLQMAANDPNDGSCPFNPPTNLADGTDYRIAIAAVNGTASAFSGYFTIASQIVVTNPVTGSIWYKGSDYNITWSSNANSNMKIELYKGSQMIRQMAANDPNDGICPFNPDFNLVDGNDYRVAVSTISGISFAYSGYFTITTNPNSISELDANKKCTLQQNYPNPFNPETTIGFSLPGNSNVELKVYNLSGQEISVIAKGEYPAGNHQFKFSGANLTSGVYYYVLKTNEKVISRKMLLVE